ncbi:O-antigen polysaccharide polymerase Wzy [Limnobaculum parvum]|nr:O-antigen polysaccharide polymerase Wzy [Limnobaculum parvum]
MKLHSKMVNSSLLILITLFLIFLYSCDLISSNILFVLSVAIVIVFSLYKRRIELQTLFLLAVIVFILGRGVIGAFGNTDVYSVIWGRAYNLDSHHVDSLLEFWSYTLLFLYIAFISFDKQVNEESAYSFSDNIDYSFYRFTFSCCYYSSLILIPISSYSKLLAFIGGGYAGLYSGQTEYSFSFLRLITFFIPIMFSLALIINESKIKKQFVFILSLFLIASLIVGQRGAFGSWMLVYIWYLTCFKKKRNSTFMLVVLGAVCLPLFQFIEAYRSGLGHWDNVIFSFFTNQGMTFFMPYFYSISGIPPVHTILASLLPLGGIFQTLSISTPETATISSWISSGLSSSHFEQGYGVGSSIFVELFAFSGNNLGIYLPVLFLFFSFIQIINIKAMTNRKYFSVFCLILPYIFLLPRGSIGQLTSQVFYSIIIVSFFYIIYRSLPKKLAK